MATGIKSRTQKPISRKEQKPFRLTEKHIRGFLAAMAEEGRTDSTIQKYRADLSRFYHFLNEDKWVYSDSLPRWKQAMLEDGYANRSVNSSICAVNGLYDFLGCWEWKCFDRTDLPEAEPPELTRKEYLRLLTEAKNQEDIQIYLLIKILACTELTPGDIPHLTREAANQGIVAITKRSEPKAVFLPKTLCRELISYAVYRGITKGELFLNTSHRSLNRSMISRRIADLGADIGLSPGKANPRNLRRMYINTLSQYQKQANAWVEKQYECLLQQEDVIAGWYKEL